MIRKLLATTAIITIVSTAAFAQTATAPATTAPAAADSVAAAQISPDSHLASHIIGQKVYNGTGDKAEHIGDVNDLVLDPSGKVESIIVGVGGFLGIGEKNVAVDYSTIDWAERDGNRWIVINATADQLKELPAFDRTLYDRTANAAAKTETTKTETTGTGTAVAPVPVAPANDATATKETSTAVAVDRAKLKPLDAGTISTDKFVGTTVYGADDKNIGEIGDVILSADGKVDSVVIDVGGFLGMGEKPVAVAMDNLAFLTDENGKQYLYTKFTKEELDAAPAYDKTTYADKRDTMRVVAPK